MTTFLTLLRRTAVAMGAIAALTVTSEANAQAGTINLSNGSSCQYTSLTVDPTGAVNVTCDTGTPPPTSPGTFSLLANVASINTGTQTTTAFQVRRVGGTAGEVVVSYTATGSGGGCTAVDSGTLTFPALSAATQNIRVLAGATSGDCTVTITVADPGLSGTLSTLTKTVPVTAPIAGCPASDVTVRSLGGSGNANGTLLLASGAIASYALPKTTKNSGIFKLSETTSTFPMAPWYYEVHISKCKGLVEETAGDGCYIKSGNQRLLSKIWMVNPTATYPSKAVMDTRGICYTPGASTATITGEQYYINIRYTYASCSTLSVCGWVPQWTVWTYN